MGATDKRNTLKGYLSRIITQVEGHLNNSAPATRSELQAFLCKVEDYEEQLGTIHKQLMAKAKGDPASEVAEHDRVMERINDVKDALNTLLDIPAGQPGGAGDLLTVEKSPDLAQGPLHTGAVPKLVKQPVLQPSSLFMPPVTTASGGSMWSLRDAPAAAGPVVQPTAPAQATGSSPAQATGSSPTQAAAFTRSAGSPLEAALAQLLQHQAAAESRAQMMMDKMNDAILRVASPVADGRTPRDQGLGIGGPHFKLPTLSVPEFAGDHTAWAHFKDMFVSIVHRNPHISNVQRFQYLMTYLAGNAKRLVASLALTDDNYEVAWRTLCMHYDDTVTVVHRHIDKFCKMAAIANPTAASFADLFTTATSVLNSLDALQEDGRDPWVIYLLLAKLDPETKVLWSRETNDAMPTVPQFLEFLRRRLKSLEIYQPLASKAADFAGKGAAKPKANVLATTAASPCPACQATDHRVFRCPAFLGMRADDRLEVIRIGKLCRKCLTGFHLTKDCAFSTCRKCSGHHNTLLHDAMGPASSNPQASGQPPSAAPPQVQTAALTTAAQVPMPPPVIAVTPPPPTPAMQPSAAPAAAPAQPAAPAPVTQSAVCSATTASAFRKIFLETVVVQVLDRHGVPTQCRALLDSGAQANLMSQSLFQRLKLPKAISNLFIGGVIEGGTRSKHQTECTIQSLKDNTHFSMTCQIVSSVVQQGIPNFTVDTSAIAIPEHLELADPTWHISQRVDLLISNEFYNDIVTGKMLKLGVGMPVLKETAFGWIVSGPCGAPKASEEPVEPIVAVTWASIGNCMRKLWELEQVEAPRPVHPHHALVERNFKTTTTRDDTGRYVVQIPFKPNLTRLHDNLPNASRQLLSLERRLDRNSDLKEQYHAAMKENLDLGFFEEVPPEEIGNSAYYMPHHCVAKAAGGSSKIRIVMNASAKSQTGLSLNDVAMVGPNIQPDIGTILLRFRENQYAFTCDIQKMYPQVLIHPPHRDYHRILWRFHEDDQVRHFRARGVCFGVNSSSFLATRVLHDVAETCNEELPHVSKTLTNNFYVDDCLASFSSLDEAQKAAKDLSSTLASAGMTLSKWCANRSDILNHRPSEAGLGTLPEHSSTLGMIWLPEEDCLTYKWKPPVHAIYTKRTVLSILCSLYDPLGLIAPVVVTGKLLMQAIGQDKASWDEPLEEPLLTAWNRLHRALPAVQTISIPRWISEPLQSTPYEVHIFCDASDVALGAVAYAVTEDSDGTRISHLIMAKSHIAPVEPSTTPRLELSAAHVGALILRKLQHSINVSEYHLWSDSTSALGHIRSKKAKLDQYFLTRVTDIQAMTDIARWHHVPGNQNPADVLSRGMLPAELKSCDLWWHGPQFIREGVRSWPRDPSVYVPQILAAPIKAPPTHTLDFILARSSHFLRLIGTVAYVMRYLADIQHITRSRGPLTPQETVIAEEILIIHTQDAYFRDLKAAIMDGSLHRTTRFKEFQPLCPFIDQRGIVRVGGRLQETHGEYDVRHPILLPFKSHLAYTIARYVHRKHMHAGPQLTHSIVTQKYWITRGRILTRSVTSTCVDCFRHRPRMLKQQMGNLPADRVNLSSAFEVCSVDFCGPLLTRPGYKRGGVAYKTYLCVFVCCATKAVHMEVVGSLTTESFIAALRRFCARRSIPREIRCDNATNFRGADAALKVLFNELQSQPDLQNECTQKGINFRFLPARSPHHGGLHEAAVKSLKHHLRREIGGTILTFEELSTIVTQIEAILNSRPLTPMPTQPGEPVALTPGHFLAFKPLVMLPSSNFTNVNPGLLTRWQLCQKLLQHFFVRFQRDYLHNLQKRVKWTQEAENLAVGDVVLLSEENVPSFNWPLGIVEEIFPGDDGRCRVVKVRTTKGSYTRAVQKLAKLPVKGVQADDDTDRSDASEGLPPSNSPPGGCLRRSSRQRRR